MNLNRFLKADFICASCQREFTWETAYSMARGWKNFNRYPAYCFGCVDTKLPEPKKPKPAKTDQRTLNKTGRTHQLGTRVRKDFLKKLKKLARKEKLKYVEVLERALDCYAEKAGKKRVAG